MHHYTSALIISQLLGCSSGIATITVELEDTTEVAGGGILSELIGSLGFDAFAQMNIVSSQELADQGVEPGDITSVTLTVVELTASSPSDADLSFLDSLSAYVEGPALPQVLVGSQDSFPEGQASVALDLEGVDLLDYVLSESMTMTTDVVGTAPVEDTTVQAYIALDVRVTVRGIVNQVSDD